MSELKTIPSYLPPRNTSSQNKKDYKYIPKKIFQTWETNQVPSGMYDAAHTWIEKNPDWEYYFFDKDDRRNFIKENFSKKVLDAYGNLIPGAYQADLFRFCLLYINGGLYVDNKAIFLSNSLNDILPKDTTFIAYKDRSYNGMEFDGYIYTTPLISKPKHPVFKKAIDMIVENCDNGFYGNDALCPTGPALLGKALNLSIGRSEKTPHVVGEHCVRGITYALWPTPDFENKIAVTDKNIPFIKMEYSDYRKDLYIDLDKNLSKNYALCWFNDKCYANGKSNRVYSKYYYSNRSMHIVEFLYIQRKFMKARVSILKFILIQPSSIAPLIKKIIKYEVIGRYNRLFHKANKAG